MEVENETFAACGACGSHSAAGAKFCGQCGSALDRPLTCPVCGAATKAEHRFCGQCGGGIVAAYAPATPSNSGVSAVAAPQPYRLPQLPIFARLRSLHDALSRRLAPAAAPMLTAGALLVVAAQVYLTFAYEPGRDAPGVGVFALVSGFALFALGAFGRISTDDTPDALDNLKIPALNAVMGKLTPLKIASLALGAAMMALLFFRLLQGSEATWDMLPWAMAIGAFALPFIRFRSISARLSIPRRYIADICIVLALIGIFTALNAQDLTDWYYSAIGDEYAHYNLAKSFAENGSERPFDLKGVYNEVNPVFASIYPAAVMRLFGADNFGWKFSLIISIAIAIPGIYILAYTFAGRTAAVVSSVILAFSHYLFAFMHTGYPNTDAIPVIVWSITLFVLGVRRGSPALIYASGVLAGFALLFNLVARAAALIIVVYALLNPEIRKRILSLFPWVLGALLTIAPVMLVNAEIIVSTTLAKIISPASQHAGEYDSALGRIMANSMQNLLAFNYNSHTSHYVSGALLDPVSAILAVLGIGYALGSFIRRSSLLLLIMLGVIAAGTALLSPYPYVPITRMPSMVVPLTLMAGIGASFLMRGISSKKEDSRRLRGGWIAAVTLSMLGAAVLALNAWQFWVETPKVFHNTQEAVAIGAMRYDVCAGAIEDVVVVGKSTIPLLKPALESYATDGRMPHLIDHADLIEGQPLPTGTPRCIVLMHPFNDEIQPFKQELANLYPQGRLETFSSPSETTVVEIFTP